jgi:hypothetical protein
MKSHKPAHVHFDPTLDLPKRIELVMTAYKKQGYVSRKTLIETYGITQLQAGSLMRDFLHAHANKTQWDMTHSHYNMTN